MHKIIIAIVWMIFSAVTYAENSDVPAESIREYLKSVNNLTADFVQIDKYGNAQGGKFYLSRPGQMRWEYIKPKSILIIMKNDKVYYHDKDLDQSSQYIVKKGLTSIFSDEDIFTSDHIKMLEVRNDTDSVSVTFADDERDEKVMLIFDKKPIVIIGLITENESGEKTIIEFSNVKNHLTPLDEGLFHYTHKLAPRRRKL